MTTEDTAKAFAFHLAILNGLTSDDIPVIPALVRNTIDIVGTSEHPVIPQPTVGVDLDVISSNAGYYATNADNVQQVAEKLMDAVNSLPDSQGDTHEAIMENCTWLVTSCAIAVNEFSTASYILNTWVQDINYAMQADNSARSALASVRNSLPETVTSAGLYPSSGIPEALDTTKASLQQLHDAAMHAHDAEETARNELASAVADARARSSKSAPLATAQPVPAVAVSSTVLPAPPADKPAAGAGDGASEPKPPHGDAPVEGPGGGETSAPDFAPKPPRGDAPVEGPGGGDTSPPNPSDSAAPSPSDVLNNFVDVPPPPASSPRPTTPDPAKPVPDTGAAGSGVHSAPKPPDHGNAPVEGPGGGDTSGGGVPPVAPGGAVAPPTGVPGADNGVPSAPVAPQGVPSVN
ncbi:hypothetical protein [Nocardia heshunensis]